MLDFKIHIYGQALIILTIDLGVFRYVYEKVYVFGTNPRGGTERPPMGGLLIQSIQNLGLVF